MVVINGLSDKAQGVLVFISSIMITIGALSVPTTIPEYVKVAFFLIGSLGFALKEVLGSPTQPAGSPTTPPVNTGSSIDTAVGQDQSMEVVVWNTFLKLNGTPSAESKGSVVSTVINPITHIQWYAVVDSTGHLVLTTIKP